MQLAAPWESVTAAHSGVPPSVNVTVPVGLAPLTVAVSVTELPRNAGLDDDTSAVVVVAPTGVTALEGAEGSPFPTPFLAVTVNV